MRFIAVFLMLLIPLNCLAEGGRPAELIIKPPIGKQVPELDPDMVCPPAKAVSCHHKQACGPLGCQKVLTCRCPPV
jgi:hypothetical protein